VLGEPVPPSKAFPRGGVAQDQPAPLRVVLPTLCLLLLAALNRPGQQILGRRLCLGRCWLIRWHIFGAGGGLCLASLLDGHLHGERNSTGS